MKTESAPVTGNEDSLKGGIEQLKDATEGLLRAAADETGGEWRRTRSRLRKRARTLRSNMSCRAQDLAEDARELRDKGQSLVREYPWVSIGIGAGLGILTGLFLRRH